MPIYQVVKMPASENVTHEVTFENIKAVREWAMANLDTRSRWIIKLNGENIGEAIEVTRYAFDSKYLKPYKKVFNTTPLRSGFFETEKEAVADYQAHKEHAEKRLESIKELLLSLEDEEGFEVQGDRIISIELGGYEFRRQV